VAERATLVFRNARAGNTNTVLRESTSRLLTPQRGHGRPACEKTDMIGVVAANSQGICTWYAINRRGRSIGVTHLVRAAGAISRAVPGTFDHNPSARMPRNWEILEAPAGGAGFKLDCHTGGLGLIPTPENAQLGFAGIGVGDDIRAAACCSWRQPLWRRESLHTSLLQACIHARRTNRGRRRLAANKALTITLA
jgi:hypothetical protein